MNSKLKVLILSLIIFMLVSVLGFSFAYFALTPTARNTTPVNVTFENGVVANFTANSTTDISVTVPGSNMLDDTVGNLAGSDNKSFNVTLQSNLDMLCTYDIYFSWNSSTTNQYTKTTFEGNEFTISGTDGNQIIEEVQIPNYNNSLNLGTYYIRTNNNTTTQTWNFTAKFYNINANQDNHADKTYSGKIDIRNAACNNVSYELATQRTFAAGEYLDTGYKINWDKDFTIEEIINIPNASQRYLVIGGYDGSSNKEMNIEISNTNQLRVYLATGGVHDIKNGTIPANKDIKIIFKWNANSQTYTANAINMETGQTVATISSGYSMSGVSSNNLRIGAADYRSNNNPFKTLTVKSLIIH